MQQRISGNEYLKVELTRWREKRGINREEFVGLVQRVRLANDLLDRARQRYCRQGGPELPAKAGPRWIQKDNALRQRFKVDELRGELRQRWADLDTWVRSRLPHDDVTELIQCYDLPQEPVWYDAFEWYILTGDLPVTSRLKGVVPNFAIANCYLTVLWWPQWRTVRDVDGRIQRYQEGKHRALTRFYGRIAQKDIRSLFRRVVKEVTLGRKKIRVRGSKGLVEAYQELIKRSPEQFVFPKGGKPKALVSGRGDNRKSWIWMPQPPWDVGDILKSSVWREVMRVAKTLPDFGPHWRKKSVDFREVQRKAKDHFVEERKLPRGKLSLSATGEFMLQKPLIRKRKSIYEAFERKRSERLRELQQPSAMRA